MVSVHCELERVYSEVFQFEDVTFIWKFEILNLFWRNKNFTHEKCHILLRRKQTGSQPEVTWKSISVSITEWLCNLSETVIFYIRLYGVQNTFPVKGYKLYRIIVDKPSISLSMGGWIYKFKSLNLDQKIYI